jgi:hypothetical protein
MRRAVVSYKVTDVSEVLTAFIIIAKKGAVSISETLVNFF